MKLVDLLVKELPKRGGWPEEAKIMSQDAAGLINAHRNERLVFLIDQFWTGTSKNDACKNFSPFYLKKATDWNTNTVTREQYEAALAASKAVAGHNGWIQWSGGECPVDSDAIVEVKYRKPNPYQFNNDRAGDFYWAHDGFGGDIIAYRLQQPTKSEQVRDDAAEADDESDLNECIGQGVDIPEWNGEGVPPVGVECEFKCATGEWVEVEITAIARNGVCFVERGKNGENYVSFSREFRPLRTEAEKLRDEAGLALYNAINWNAEGEMVSPSRMEDYKKAYDAIAAGKIPGVKLEDK